MRARRVALPDMGKRLAVCSHSHWRVQLHQLRLLHCRGLCLRVALTQPRPTATPELLQPRYLRLAAPPLLLHPAQLLLRCLRLALALALALLLGLSSWITRTGPAQAQVQVWAVAAAVFHREQARPAQTGTAVSLLRRCSRTRPLLCWEAQEGLGRAHGALEAVLVAEVEAAGPTSLAAHSARSGRRQQRRWPPPLWKLWRILSLPCA